MSWTNQRWHGTVITVRMGNLVVTHSSCVSSGVPLKNNCHTKIYLSCRSLPFSGPSWATAFWGLHITLSRRSWNLQTISMCRYTEVCTIYSVHTILTNGSVFCIDIHLEIALVFGRYYMLCILKNYNMHIWYIYIRCTFQTMPYVQSMRLASLFAVFGYVACVPMLRTHKLGELCTYREHGSPQLRRSLSKTPNPTLTSKLCSNPIQTPSQTKLVFFHNLPFLPMCFLGMFMEIDQHL